MDSIDGLDINTPDSFFDTASSQHAHLTGVPPQLSDVCTHS